MRRIAALVLLCVFGTLLPSATVLALAAPQQLLPICCRAHGAHSCIMGSMADASSYAAPTAPARMALFPAQGFPWRIPFLTHRLRCPSQRALIVRAFEPSLGLPSL